MSDQNIPDIEDESQLLPLAEAPAVAPGTLLPGSIIDLKNWYVTLPIGPAEHPTCVEPPLICKFCDPSFFFVNDTKDAVVFRAPCGGVTTKGSGYPRSELREMVGGKLASWDCSKGTHTMTVTEAVHFLPVVKPHTVVAQIHDAKDDVIEVRLTEKVLEVIHNTKHYVVLDPAYVLGKVFTIRIVAGGGNILVYYNDLQTPKVKIPAKNKGCYFKAGAYTQSNPSKGDKVDAYSEVWIYKVDVTHTA
jgi:poly(beta-D-mannuronate) lyase